MLLDSSFTAPQVTAPAIPKPRVLYDACPLCSAPSNSTLRTEDCSQHPLYKPVVGPIMTWMRCAACEHVFTDGYFSGEVCAEVFSSTNPGQLPGASFEQNRHVSARIVERVAQYVADGRWLDVGLGNGLVAAHRLLREDGVIFASMPSYDCAAWRLLDAGNANPYWGELEHFHNFSRQRL
ncbi:hypothetical protein ABZ865_28835 [Streptomyces sp. NPDC047085]|uniref:hypothetical protein n=1 Tax=Streptomyces sp. NPDC047085 TaxID=3155140 RepID=UPI0033F62627